MASETGSENKNYNSSMVILNELILSKVFSHLALTTALPYRLVCKTWKATIDIKISKEFEAKLHFDFIFFSAHLGNFKTWKNSKLSLKLDFHQFSKLEENESIVSETFEALKECGHLVKTIKLLGSMDTEVKWQQLKDVLILTPNLELLEMDCVIKVPMLTQVFQNFCHHNLLSLRFPDANLPEEKEQLVNCVLKCFPNLETNFGDETTDFQRLKVILENKRSSKLKTWKSENVFFYDFEPNANILKTISPRFVSLTKLELLEIENCDQVFANSLTSILQNFASTLKTIKLLCFFVEAQNGGGCVAKIPPLPQLREIHLGIPAFTEVEPPFVWNLGKKCAIDFPLLEYLVLESKSGIPPLLDWNYEEKQKNRVSDPEGRFTFPVPQSWEIWEPFVPLLPPQGGEEKADLSPLKFLKFVDLSIPTEWMGKEENREWGKHFLEVYLQLYGCAGQGTVQDMVNWLG